MFSRVVLCVAFLAACGNDALERPALGPDGEAASALEHRDDNSVVSRLGDGLFKNDTGFEVTTTPSGPSRRAYVDWGYWIDLDVKNLAFEKQVGIVWSADGWLTTNTARAEYEGGLGGNRERWGVDLGGRSFSGAPPVIEYATFAEMNGVRYWGKQGNSQNYVLHPF